MKRDALDRLLVRNGGGIWGHTKYWAVCTAYMILIMPIMFLIWYIPVKIVESWFGHELNSLLSELTSVGVFWGAILAIFDKEFRLKVITGLVNLVIWLAAIGLVIYVGAKVAGSGIALAVLVGAALIAWVIWRKG